ncbi:MAG: cytochrome c5 family protein [Candidatus Accumulibacter sp.]|uniref:Cytochrome c5 family protein n=1 Tax=Candidatus Accumulibacter proximus TaxID=2954385 RepID=A0A935UHE4_9PROT|nr:cytochrome c5 family protein [Candidatus Accumulibacter proximus]
MNKTPLLVLALLSAIVAGCGRQETATAPTAAPAPGTAAPAPAPAPVAAAPAPAPVAAAPAPAANAAGESVFKKTCAMCHAAGVAGAPKPGDKADWGPRIAQGSATLYKHAIEGFTGAKGMMPPRGGGASLSDDDVKAAVDYMVAKSQ